MKLTIAMKLGMIAGLGALAAAGIAAIGYTAIQHTGVASGAGAPATRAVYLQGTLDMMHDAVRAEVLSALVATEARDVDEARAELEDHGRTISELMTELHALPLPATVQAMVNAADAPLQSYVQEGREVITLASRDHDAAKGRLSGFYERFSRLEEMLGGLGEAVQAAADAASAAAVEQANADARELGVAALAALLLLFAASFFIARSVLTGLRSIGEAAQAIADGRLDVEIHYRAHDELGLLASQFRQMAQHLSRVISSINQSAEQVASSSNELSSSSRNLAENATRSAAAIQEVGASTAETAQRSSEASEQIEATRALAHEVLTAARRGDQQMQEMVRAISEVDAAAHDISKVIKVIDDIAFQINLLSLNAAVEAARAGEHGRGFAVVAEEVRNLATRSARAAQETAALIQGSISKARQGTAIAEVTATALTEIGERIGQMTTLAEQAASNTQAQRLAISGVNGAIQQVDESVQNNTAGAEEMAATATELSRQADELRRAVSQFTVGRSAASAPAPSRRQHAPAHASASRGHAPARAASRAHRPAHAASSNHHAAPEYSGDDAHGY